jgi:DNA-binding CsgD family transcriptional regulator
MEVLVNRKDSVIISERDIQIVQSYSDGVSRDKIADKHKISVRTLEAATNKLRSEFGCKNLTHLVAEFFRKGLIK